MTKSVNLTAYAQTIESYYETIFIVSNLSLC